MKFQYFVKLPLYLCDIKNINILLLHVKCVTVKQMS